jgi:hypothetical protein
MHNGCVLTGGVGTGKTVTAFAYYYTKVMGGVINDWTSVKIPMDIYVFTTARKRDDLDWELWGMRFGVTNDRTASRHGLKLVVDSYNNIEKYKGVSGAFLIFDEQKLVGNGVWSKTFVTMAKANRWVMLSATPGDKWEDYIPLFLANGFYKNRTEFVREHCIYSYYGKFPKLERYINVRRLIKQKNSIIVEMPYERHTKRHISEVFVEYDKKLFDRVVKERWNPYEERPLRDVAELFSVMRKVANSDPSRLTEIRHLMEKHPRLIVFYTFDYELEILRQLADSPTETKTSGGSTEKISSSSNGRTSSTSSPEAFSPSRSSRTNSYSAKILTTSSTTSTSTAIPMRSSITETGLERSSKLPHSSPIEASGSKTTHSSTPKQIPNSHRASASTSRLTSTKSETSRKTGLDLDQWTKSLQKSDSPSSCSSSIDDSATPRTSSHSGSASSTPKTDTSISDSTGAKTESTTIAEARLDDPWVDTIWAKDYIPPAGEDDPREEMSAIKAKYNFDRAAKKTDRRLSSIRNETGETKSLSSEENSSKPSGVITTDPLVMAEWNGHNHDPIPLGERWVYLVQYTAGAEAWDCITTDAVAYYSQTYSYKVFEQSQGRIDRMNTPYIDLYLLCTQGQELHRHGDR